MNEKWSDVLKELNKLGFKVVIRRRFESEGAHPEFVIAAHPTKYLLVVMTSYTMGRLEVLNSGSLYGAVYTVSSAASVEDSNVLNVGGGGYRGENMYEFDVDFVGSLNRVKYAIAQLETRFRFIKWNDPNRYINVMDYNQDKLPAYTSDTMGYYHKERAKFMAAAPEWVRDFIVNS